MSKELKPCPFCGSNDIEYWTTNSKAHWYECDPCGGKKDSEKTKNLAFRSWNKRPEKDLLDA